MRNVMLNQKTKWPIICLAVMVFAGCQGEAEKKNESEKEVAPKSETTKKTGESAKSSAIVNKSFSAKKDDPQGESQTKKPSTKIVKKSFSSGSNNSFATKSFGGGNKRKANLTKAIWDYGLESQESNATAIVWLFDLSQSATKLREKVSSEIKAAKTTEGKKPFESVIVGYSSEGLNVASQRPTTEASLIKEDLEKLTEGSEGAESTFKNLNECLKKNSYLRTTSRKTVIFVLVTDEAGDDPYEKVDGKNLVDEIALQLKKFSIPLFVIGYAAPFGRKTDLVEGQRSQTVYGPETAYAQRVNLAMWNGSTDLFRYDSGFGPWNLERLCRSSGGRFLADRPATKSMRLVSKMQSNWPAVTSRQFDDSLMAAYKPFYGSKADYESDLNSNKAKLALHNAAKLPYTKVFRMQDYEFREAAEAARVREINGIQRIPAVIRPGLEKLYDILRTGEGDRDKLDSKRWQVSFDLAYGRTMANYVRVIGLNSMLAELKGGKTFANAGSNSWVLVPDEEVSTGSSNRKMADKAKTYLNRVIQEHPKTPWALIAAKELESPFGWKWEEAKR